jgi:cellulose synthase/poly-beta-1,6-N-acetylglucosamine synthase-like glycosyltransferase
VIIRLWPAAKLPDASGSNDYVGIITVIVAAHNEENRIRNKVAATIELRKVYSDLEILVASDASSDNTDDIVRSFAADNVRLVRSDDRLGKEHAQGLAVKEATGDIIIFTDAGTTIQPSSVRRLVQIFGDKTIGAVSSVDRVLSEEGTPEGEGLYVRYEMWLREIESRKGGLIGLSGSFFAIRKEVAQDWRSDVPSDFCAALNAHRIGLKSVTDRNVIGEYRTVRRAEDEFARKTRTILRGMMAIAAFPQLLNPFHHGLFAFQILSHKVMRWAVPWFAILYAGVSIVLAYQNVIHSWLLLPPATVASLAMLAGILPSTRSLSLLSTCYFFVQSNFAAMVALAQFMRGNRITTWQPSVR